MYSAGQNAEADAIGRAGAGRITPYRGEQFGAGLTAYGVIAPGDAGVVARPARARRDRDQQQARRKQPSRRCRGYRCVTTVPVHVRLHSGSVPRPCGRQVASCTERSSRPSLMAAGRHGADKAAESRSCVRWLCGHPGEVGTKPESARVSDSSPIRSSPVPIAADTVSIALTIVFGCESTYVFGAKSALTSLTVHGAGIIGRRQKGIGAKGLIAIS